MSCQSMDPLWLLSDPTFNTETNILFFFPQVWAGIWFHNPKLYRVVKYFRTSKFWTSLMIRDERPYELSCLPYWCVSHHHVDATSSAEPLGFCMYPVGPSSHMPSRFVLLPVPCLPALLLFLHPHLLHLCSAATCSVVQIIHTSQNQCICSQG